MDSTKSYIDFHEEYFDYNAWKPDSAFLINNLSSELTIRLNNYKIIEQTFNGIGYQRDENLYSDLLQKFKTGLIKEFSKKERTNVFLYSIEHKKKLISKIRTFKGLLDKNKIKQKLYFQSENKLDNNYSIISFIAILLKDDTDFLLKYFFDDSTCFVVKSDNDYLNKEFLDLIHSTIDLSNNVQLDYLKLLFLFCNKDDIIYRIGGNSGEEYWSLQKFIKK